MANSSDPHAKDVAGLQPSPGTVGPTAGLSRIGHGSPRRLSLALALTALAAVPVAGCTTVAKTVNTASFGLLGNSNPGPAPSTSFDEAVAGASSGTGIVSTGTVVGQKIERINTDIGRLKATVVAQRQRAIEVKAQTVAASEAYHGIVAAVQARLQIGTTPGNPLLIEQWNQAQTQLDSVTNGVNTLGQLAQAVSGSASAAAFLLSESQAAMGLSGGIDQDRVSLVLLEDEASRLVGQVEKLMSDISDQISRQTVYVAGERGNLTTLALAIRNGEIYGESITTRSFTPSRVGPGAFDGSGSAGDRVSAPSSTIQGRRALVTIRFDRDDVAYQQALYTAVSKVLEQRPQSGFDLIALAPAAGTAADIAVNQSRSKRFAQDVLRTLTDMGVPSNKISLSAVTSDEAAVNEVRLYVR